MHVSRPVIVCFSAPEVREGTATVRRPVPTSTAPSVGPIIFFDHIGPRIIEAGAIGATPAHPHAGLDTVSYVMEGCAEHHDSLGNTASVRAGDAQWMRAGRGVLHTEGPGQTIRENGGRVHVAQLWLNLPGPHKHDAPAYRTIARNEIPRIFLADASVHLLAGCLDGREGPIETFTETLIAHVVLAADGSTLLRVSETLELGMYCLAGAATIDGHRLDEGSTALLGHGDRIVVQAPAGAELMIFGGAPLDAPIVRHGPFVMSTQAQIDAGSAIIGKAGWAS